MSGWWRRAGSFTNNMKKEEPPKCPKCGKERNSRKMFSLCNSCMNTFQETDKGLNRAREALHKKDK